MGDPISFIIYLVVLALVCYLLFWILNQIPMPAPIRTVVVVLVALVVLLWLLQRTGLLAI